jgi:hypothetical protein
LLLFRRAWDWLLDLVTLAGLGVLDWLAPLQETPVDWAIRDEGERLRRAFPWLDAHLVVPRKFCARSLIWRLRRRCCLDSRRTDSCDWNFSRFDGCAYPPRWVRPRWQ